MNRRRGSTNVRRIRNVTENRPEMTVLQSPLMSASYDSGVGNELDLSQNSSSRMNQSTYSPTADIMSYRLQHMHFEQHTNSDINPDENKENEHPFSRSVRTNRINTSDSTYIHRRITGRIASRRGRLENDNEQENSGSTSPCLTENRVSTSPCLTENRGSTSPLLIAHTPPYRPPAATPDSAMSLSPFNSSLLACDPISVTPTHSRSRRLAKARAEEVEDASLADMPDVNHCGPNGTPPRTPSPLLTISGLSKNRNSSEVLINQHKKEELAVIIDKETEISTNFITPPCKPLAPPGAPRKKKVDKDSRPAISSPFPETPVSRGLKKSRTAGRVYRRKCNSRTHNTSVSPMVLRSALKPRRSPRIKRMSTKHNLHHRDIRMRRKALL